jgi:outer membrane protein assembly factor BamD (BamD/ComL family)
VIPSFSSKLKKCLLSGQKKCEKGEYTQALREYQNILKAKEVNSLTNAQILLLAKIYTKSAEILSIGTIQDEKLALDYLDKALKLYPNLDEAIELKRDILADNAISPLFYKKL